MRKKEHNTDEQKNSVCVWVRKLFQIFRILRINFTEFGHFWIFLDIFDFFFFTEQLEFLAARIKVQLSRFFLDFIVAIQFRQSNFVNPISLIEF